MLDIIVIIIIIGSGLISAKLGFIRSIYQLLSSVIALGLSFVVYPIITQILKLTPMYSWIQSSIYKMMPAVESGLGTQTQEIVIGELTKGFPPFITEKLIANNNPEIYRMLGVTKLIDYIAVSLSNIALSIVGVLIAWLVIKVGLSIAVGILDLVSKLPLLKTANQFAGFGVGVLKGLLGVWLVCISVPALLLIPKLAGIQEMIQGSILTNYLYENNIILQIVSELLLK